MSLTYVTLVSVVPLLAIAFATLTGFGVQNQLEPLLVETLQPLGVAGVQMGRRLLDVVNSVDFHALGALGAISLLYTTVSMLSQMENCLNHIWQVRKARSWLSRFTAYLSLALVGPILIGLGFALLATAQANWLPYMLPVDSLLTDFVTRIVPFLFFATALAFIYKFLPCTRVNLSSALFGGFTAALLWNLAVIAFANFVVSSTRYAVVYSGFAVAVLVLIWLYTEWLIVLVGAELAFWYQYRALRRFNSNPDPDCLKWEAATLTLVLQITRKHLHDSVPTSIAELAVRTGLSLPEIEVIVERLVALRIVLRTEDSTMLALARPADRVTINEVLSVIRDLKTVLPKRVDKEILNILSKREASLDNPTGHLSLRDLAEADEAPLEIDRSTRQAC